MPRGVYPHTNRKPLSEETKAKIAASLTGKRHSSERRAKSSAVRKGRTLTNEHKQAISASVKLAMRRPEVIEKRYAGIARALDNNPEGRFYRGGKGQEPLPVMLDFAAVLCPVGYLMDKIIVLKGPGMNAGHYTLDFGHPEAKVDIEIDGSSHQLKQQKDNERDAILRSLGWKVIRIKV